MHAKHLELKTRIPSKCSKVTKGNEKEEKRHKRKKKKKISFEKAASRQSKNQEVEGRGTPRLSLSFPPARFLFFPVSVF